MLITTANEGNHIADLHEVNFLTALDGRKGITSREELQEKNSKFLKKLKEKFFPVKGEDRDQVLMNFLKSLPACSSGRRETERKRQVKRILQGYEELQLI